MMTTLNLDALDSLDFDYVQKRAARNQRKRSSASDVYVCLTETTKGKESKSRLRQQVSVRLSKTLMDGLGWQAGDLLHIGFNADAGVLQLARTTDASLGYTLSPNGEKGKHSSCSAKFAPEPSTALEQWVSLRRAFHCRVIAKSALRIFVQPID